MELYFSAFQNSTRPRPTWTRSRSKIQKKCTKLTYGPTACKNYSPQVRGGIPPIVYATLPSRTSLFSLIKSHYPILSISPPSNFPRCRTLQMAQTWTTIYGSPSDNLGYASRSLKSGWVRWQILLSIIWLHFPVWRNSNYRSQISVIKLPQKNPQSNFGQMVFPITSTLSRISVCTLVTTANGALVVTITPWLRSVSSSSSLQ